eukprot:TRINITY_DN64895_c0_g1_i1.p1 TRINITY_DN64895_c0_g1~~TRINITY_DN64895_c0_g1_i1.p1  ORF type:complete len:464 (-),score=83.56 TRINITY_DN64895_c0_g1_i1:743-2134(-)
MTATQVQVGTGFTALHHATEAGHLEAVRLLSDAKASVSQPLSSSLYQPLHLAALQGDAALVKLLQTASQLEHSSKAEGAVARAVELAASAGHVEALEALALGNASQAPLGDQRGSRALLMAVSNGHAETVRWLVRAGADVNGVDDTGKRPLHEAARGGLQAMAEALVKQGAKVNGADADSHTVLHHAATGGHTAMMDYFAGFEFKVSSGGTISGRRLIEALSAQSAGEDSSMANNAKAEYLAAAMVANGASLTVDAKDKSLLHLAAESGHHHVVQWLLERRALPGVAAPGSRAQPLHLAAAEGHREVVSILLDSRASLGATSRGSLQPLHFATKHSHLSVADLLIQKRAATAAKAADGSQPLHLLVASSQAHRGRMAGELVTRLIEAKAVVNAKTRRGDSALHRCVSSAGCPAEVLQKLVAYRADLEAKSADGQTPEAAAKAAGREDLLVILRSSPAARSLEL